MKEEQWTRKAEVISFDKIEPKEIEWLWPNRIPLGMLTIMAGDPGVGKSFLSLFISSTVSTARCWPDGTASASGTTIILNCEDSPEHIMRPRLDVLKADLSKIKWIQSIHHKNGEGSESSELFNLMEDLSALEGVMQDNPDTKLIIIDPLSAYFGWINTNKETSVRAVLAPLSELARRYNVALVCVMHLNKGSSTKAIYRTNGSVAFPGTARAVWLVSPDPGQPGGKRRLLLPAKHNILNDPTTLAFEIKDGAVIFESQPVDITADEVFAPKSSIEAPERTRAVEWLKEILSGVDSMPSNEIFKLAEEQNINERTLARAKKEMGIKSYLMQDDDGNKTWFWRLPGPDGDKKKLPTLSEMYAKLNKMQKEIKLPSIK